MPDEEVADELERSAARAQARGGFAAAAAFLERAVTLTRDPLAERSDASGRGSDEVPRRCARRRARPSRHGRDGALERPRSCTSRLAARADRIRRHARQQCATAAARGRPTAGDADPTLARETYLEALSAAMFAGRFAGPGGSALDVALAARRGTPPPRAPRGSDLLLDALATLFSDTYEAAVPILRRAQAAFSTDKSAIEQLRWKWLATIASVHLWDDVRWETMSERHVRLARETGALGELPLALSQRVYVHLLRGRTDGSGVARRRDRSGDRRNRQHPDPLRRGGTRRATRPRGRGRRPHRPHAVPT